MCSGAFFASVLLARPDGWMAGASEHRQAAPSPSLAAHFFLFVGKSWVKTFSPTFIGQEPPLSTCYHWPRFAHALPYGANPLGPLARSAIKYLARSFTAFAAADDAQAQLLYINIPTRSSARFGTRFFRSNCNERIEFCTNFVTPCSGSSLLYI